MRLLKALWEIMHPRVVRDRYGVWSDLPWDQLSELDRDKVRRLLFLKHENDIVSIWQYDMGSFGARRYKHQLVYSLPEDGIMSANAYEREQYFKAVGTFEETIKTLQDMV